MPTWPGGMRSGGTSEDEGPLAIVTGASSGIGYELARLLAHDGYRLLLVARDPARLEAAAASLRAGNGGRRLIETHVVDLADPDGLDEMACFANTLCPDVLVNNAGFGGYGPFARTGIAREVEMISTNVTALTVLAKAVLPPMLERGSGRILNVGSTASFAPGPFAAVYAATKAYVLSFSEALSDETRGSGVTVTALCPGPTHTAFAARAGMGETKVFKSTIADAESVAQIGYAAMKAGKPVVVAGRFNKLLVFMVRLVPRSLVVQMSRRAFTLDGGK